MIGISANSCVILHLTGGYVARYHSPKFALTGFAYLRYVYAMPNNQIKRRKKVEDT